MLLDLKLSRTGSGWREHPFYLSRAKVPLSWPKCHVTRNSEDVRGVNWIPRRGCRFPVRRNVPSMLKDPSVQKVVDLGGVRGRICFVFRGVVGRGAEHSAIFGGGGGRPNGPDLPRWVSKGQSPARRGALVGTSRLGDWKRGQSWFHIWEASWEGNQKLNQPQERSPE